MEKGWIEHRRGRDGELLGWIKPVDDGFVAMDLLGREKTAVVDWLVAEETLDEVGIAYLAEPYELLLDSGVWLRVRLVEVSANQIRVKKEDWGDMTASQIYYTVPLPIPGTLRLLSA